MSAGLPAGGGPGLEWGLPSGLDQSAVERIQGIIAAYPYQEPTNL
ncbi:hypothetical protein [Arthrobacter psychrochitiniphilus]